MSESLSSQSDADLLKRFSKTRCELAFEELVDRYGRLVMSISSRALQNQHDAEDVFQATFLVLAKNASKIRKRESLPSWLSGVAYRLSMKLALKRHRKDLALNAEPQAARDHFADLERRFDEQAMDEELQSLPSKYRDVLVRFYFLGQTSRQIAEALGITQGAADGRIKRGRQELRVRLAKRGVALGAFSVMALSAKTASASVAPALAKSAVAAAVAKSSVGAVTPAAMNLAGSELMRTSSMISSVAATCAVVVVLGLGAFGLNLSVATAMAGGPVINTEVAVEPDPQEVQPAWGVVGYIAQESGLAAPLQIDPQQQGAAEGKAINVPNPGVAGQPVQATTSTEDRTASSTIAIQEGDPDLPDAFTNYVVQHHPAEDLAYLIGKLIPDARLAADRDRNHILAVATAAGHETLRKTLGKLDRKQAKVAEQINGSDVYEFKDTDVEQLAERLQQQFSTGLVRLTGADKRRGEIVVIGSDEMRARARKEIESIEKDAFKKEIVCQSAITRRWQHIYRIKGDKEELIKQARIKSPKATFGFPPEGHLVISGTGAELKPIRELFEKAEPQSLFAQTAIDRRGQAKLRPQMQQAAFADQNVEMGDPNVRAQDRYVLENMPAADAIEKIQEVVPKAELADFGGNVLLMIGPMELRGAVSDAVTEIDPNARKTVHQLVRPAQQAAAPPSSSAGEASGTFITAKLSQDGKSIAVDMPNGKPVTETYDVNVPFVVNGKTLIQKQRRNRIVAPAGPSRKLFKTSEIVISTVGGARPTEAQVREQLDGKKPIILLQADQKLSDFHRNTLRQSMIMISIPRQDAGPKKHKQKANDPQARTIEPLGIELAPIDTRTRRLLVDERITGGLRVVSVVEGGAADKRGVRVGDILIGLNRWETTDFRELDYVLRQESTWTNHSVFYVARSSEEGEYSRFFGAMKLAGLKPGAIR